MTERPSREQVEEALKAFDGSERLKAFDILAAEVRALREELERAREALPMICDGNPRHLYSAAHENCPSCLEIAALKQKIAEYAGELGRAILAPDERYDLKAQIDALKTRISAACDFSDMWKSEADKARKELAAGQILNSELDDELTALKQELAECKGESNGKA